MFGSSSDRASGPAGRRAEGAATGPETLAGGDENTPPAVLAGLPDAAADEDLAFSLTIPPEAFADPDAGDVLTFSATLADGTPLPGWLTFDAATGRFDGTPTNDEVGETIIRVTATDLAGASTSDDFVLTVVNVNDAPVGTGPIGDRAAEIGQPFAFALPAGTFVDVDAGDALIVAATLADGTALPAWLTFDPATGAFGGSPGAEDGGFLSVLVTATDAAGASATGQFALTIAEPGTTLLLVDGSGSIGGFPTIGAAIEAARGIDGPVTILIADGTYVEQVTIDRGDLTLRGQSAAGVIIRAPAVLSVQGTHAPFGAAGDLAAVVAVIDAANVRIENLGIDGAQRVDEALAAGADGFFGILFLRAAGGADGVTVEDVAGAASSPGFRVGHGIGVLADYDPADPHPTAGRQSFSLTDSAVLGFQKTGLLAYNAELTVTGNIFQGLGATASVVQNALQLSRNTIGSVAGNTIGGIGYVGGSTGFDDAAAIVVTDSVGGLSIAGNTIGGTTAADDTAIFLLDSVDVAVQGNHFDRWFVSIADLDDTIYGANFTPGALNAVGGNTLGNVGIDLRFDPGVGAGSAFDVIGNAGDDLLFGGGGADTLGGSAGNDTLAGRGGDDTYRLGLDQTVREGVGRGNDHILAGTDVLDLAGNVERLTLLGSVRLGYGNSIANEITGNAAGNDLKGFEGADLLLGADGNDTLEGGEGNDTLDGGVGTDLLRGGNGDDTYRADNRRDVMNEANNAGRDLVLASVSFSIANSAGIENLTMIGAGTATGNALANLLTGAAVANRLVGAAGADTLVGGAGRDTLVGGADADLFRFLALGDGATVLGNADIVADFDAQDVIDLAAIDANAAIAGDQAFAFVGGAAFNGVGQARFRFDQARNETIVELNVAGSTAAEMLIRLSGNVALTGADFLL